MLVLDFFSTSKAFLDHFVTLPNLGASITVFEIQMHCIAISHCFFLFNPQALDLFVPGLKIFRAELTNNNLFSCPQDLLILGTVRKDSSEGSAALRHLSGFCPDTL